MNTTSIQIGAEQYASARNDNERSAEVLANPRLRLLSKEWRPLPHGVPSWSSRSPPPSPSSRHHLTEPPPQSQGPVSRWHRVSTSCPRYSTRTSARSPAWGAGSCARRRSGCGCLTTTLLAALTACGGTLAAIAVLALARAAAEVGSRRAAGGRGGASCWSLRTGRAGSMFW